MVQHHSADIEKWLKLIRSDGIGPVLFKRLLDAFGDVDRILAASAARLAEVKGISQTTAQQIARTRNTFNAEKEIEHADKLGVWIVHLHDPRYPPALKAIYDPPPVLYVKGTLTRADTLALAIVGSRRCTLYGTEQAGRFAHLLASAGFTIVSGGARGIDAAAHRGALSAKGRTIVVQGSGLANPFPAENQKLFEQAAESGAVISELPLTYEPLAANFPGRNRIIAGLSLGVLVVEAAHRSGALISAQAALDNNREVMAVPGRIDSPASAGCHQLIKQGARLVDSIDDIMAALGNVGDGLQDYAASAAGQAEQNAQKSLFDVSRLNLTKEENAILDCLNSEPVHVEDLIAQTKLTAGQVHAAAVSLQLKGLIRQLPGGMFVKRHQTQ
ncbi:MAG TPA: DNA-processing protein DprA [Anaerohalosphaeraceae bacterium]|nr:DNA-processing protein DprA [Phycisphaerae bacterium]HOL30709.1 DNA-processing protein DprA [Anaerohalosphaeraceae bacterium]HOM75141.1 DNA-processing protein DprA [Anaerohalosphaeraceae bacterium]HPC63450.1 DNA-processing protein DprA [Anaerohalosphaeraceae bacterium]HPO70837.1 DNA-processing protein DprA [Anaerohalosphaeraceae bacterium]